MFLFQSLFGFRGRLNRAGFAVCFAVYISVFLLFLATEKIAKQAGDGALAGLALVGLMLWMLFSAMARRFHDIGKSGWGALLVFVPVVGLITPFVMLFYPGDVSTNEYGPPSGRG